VFLLKIFRRLFCAFSIFLKFTSSGGVRLLGLFLSGFGLDLDVVYVEFIPLFSSEYA
jgi:hypothetical protein